MVRSKSGVSATCLARVDPSAAQAGANMFEFTFVIAPYLSRLDVQALQIELQKHPEFNGYQFSFPTTLSATASTLATTFGSPASFSVGPDPHTFAVTLPVVDGVEAPAVADANLLIQRLCSTSGADLFGTLNLSVDPSQTAPITAAVDLNFFHTVGTDDLSVSIDPTNAIISVTNQSLLDATIEDCAVLQNGALAPLQGQTDVAGGATVELALPAGTSVGPSSQFFADAELKLPSPVPPATVMKILNFVTVNVTTTELFVAIDASAVDFTNITSLTAVVVFPAANASAPTQFTVTKVAPVASGQVTLPLEVAISSLRAAIEVTVLPTDPNAKSWSFTLQNDFNSEPTVSIHQSDIDTNKPS
jgi:hypothetical protein